MVFVAGGATILSFLVLLTMVKTNIGKFKGKKGFSDAQFFTSVIANVMSTYYWYSRTIEVMNKLVLTSS